MKRAALFMLVAVCACGCAGGPYKGQTLYTLEGGAASEAAASPKPPHAGTLRVRPVSVSQPYAGTQFAYKYADGRMRNDPYAGLIAAPESLLSSAIIDRLQREKVFESVIGNSMPAVPAYELAVSMRVLGAEFKESGGEAAIQGTVYLLDPTAQPEQLLATYEVSARAPLAGDTPAAVAQALNVALASWIGDLSAHLRAGAVPALAGNNAADKAALK